MATACGLALIVCALIHAGCGGLRYDRILKPAEQRRMRTAVIVSSRVLDSPNYACCASTGVTVWDKQFSSLRLGGPLMAASGKRQDTAAAERINLSMGSGYDIEKLLANRLYDRLSAQVSYTVISRDEAIALGMPTANYQVDGEQVRRLQDYAGVAKSLSADAIIDVRLVEWALVRQPASGDLKVRLRVRVKIVSWPDNQLLYHNEFVNETDTRNLERKVDDYARNYGELLRSETSLVMDSLLTVILRQIVV